MQNPDQKNWNEFDWERELRKDDDRINSYMTELSKFIDLPGEEDIILKSLQNHSKPIPQSINLGSEMEGVLDDDNFEEAFVSNEWRKKDNAIIYTIVEKMASQWASFLASRLVAANMPQGMRIICYFGKLMARIGDVIGIDSELPPALRIALCKRITTIINELLGEVDKINDLQGDMAKETLSHSRRLQIIREKIIDFMEKLREADKK